MASSSADAGPAARPGPGAASGGRVVIDLIDDDDEDDLPSRRAKRRRRHRRRESSAPPSSDQAVVCVDDDEDPPVRRAPDEPLAMRRIPEDPTAWLRPDGPITCPVCFCESEPNESATLVGCSHSFCVECLSQYVRGKVEAGEVLSEQLSCPCVEPKRCGVPLVPQDVSRCLATPAERERYERLALNRCIEAEDDMQTCPTAGCPFAFAWEKDNRKFECPLCHKSFCLVCRCEPWHRGMRCEQFQAERGDPEASDAAFASFAKNQKLRQCPKCKFFVEKSSGCDAMHCRCGLVFCYKCGGVLKATARASGFEQCACGRQREAELAAHGGPGVINHNRPDQANAARAGQMARAAAAAAAAAQAAVRGIGRQGGRRGWGGMVPAAVAGVLPAHMMAMLAGALGDGDEDDEDDDDEDDDDW